MRKFSCSKALEDQKKNAIFKPKKVLPQKKIKNKRNISSLKKIPSINIYTFGSKKPIIENSFAKIKTTNNNNISNCNLKNNFHLNKKNKKLISIKTLKKTNFDGSFNSSKFILDLS